MDRLDEFITENRNAAAEFLTLVRAGHYPAVIVHHNDADGLAAAAALVYAFERLDLTYRLLPVEKIHEPVVERIHESTRDIIIYADLGGQSSGLIGRHAPGSPQVIILDHHLPGGAVPDNVIHVNPEHHGISGDEDASGACVCALFARELLRAASLNVPDEEALLCALGVVGAMGDKQVHAGEFTGANRMLVETAIQGGHMRKTAHGYTLPALHNRSIDEMVNILNLLGSVGFYSGMAEKGVDFLLGRNSGEALRASAQLQERMASCFRQETQDIRVHGLESSVNFQWVDVKDRFVPMGVKAIGLFLEYLMEENLASAEKYLIGFQHLPAEMPGIGHLEGSLTKISARVHPALKESIHEGLLPDFMTLIPKATALVQGTADGCHRFTAAALIQQGREAEFVGALEKILAQACEDLAG